jgi:hypothetical protein
MKQFILKPTFLIVALLVVSTIVGTSTNACDKKIFTKNCLPEKQTEQKKSPGASAETGGYTDFILTNSILRF